MTASAQVDEQDRTTATRPDRDGTRHPWLPDTPADSRTAHRDRTDVDATAIRAAEALGATVSRLSPALGADVVGVDLATLGPAGLDLVADLLLAHQVLFFPGQHLDVDRHVAIGRHFGPLAQHPNLTNPFTDHDELFELAASTGGIADEWHTDLTFLAEPAVLSVLNMVQCPDLGGDTMWSNLELAYATLSAPLRDLVDGLTALHDAQPHGRPEQATIHPVVRHHPETGRPALYVSEHFTRRIVELSPTESDLLLGHLTRWVQDPRFTVRRRWTPGTIAMWDNRCTQHYVLNDFVGERIIQRVTVMGDQPRGLAPRWQPWAPARGAASRHDWAVQRQLRAREADPIG